MSNTEDPPPLDSTIYTLVENVRSLYNVGAIFRTADGAGVSRVLLTGITGRPPHREIRKVALGAEECVPWEYHSDSVTAIQGLKRRNFQIVALETGPKGLPFDRVDYRSPVCLVVGHEYHGLSRETLDAADLIVQIPMKGSKISLNVAVAFGIAVYKIASERHESCSTTLRLPWPN